MAQRNRITSCHPESLLVIATPDLIRGKQSNNTPLWITMRLSVARDDNQKNQTLSVLSVLSVLRGKKTKPAIPRFIRGIHTMLDHPNKSGDDEPTNISVPPC